MILFFLIIIFIYIDIFLFLTLFFCFGGLNLYLLIFWFIFNRPVTSFRGDSGLDNKLSLVHNSDRSHFFLFIFVNPLIYMSCRFEWHFEFNLFMLRGLKLGFAYLPVNLFLIWCNSAL